MTNEEKSLLYASTVVGSSRDVARACGDTRARRAREGSRVVRWCETRMGKQ